MRSVTAGAVGKVGWLVPHFLVYAGWRTLRDPERNGPAGRQVIGWSALLFGVLDIQWKRPLVAPSTGEADPEYDYYNAAYLADPSGRVPHRRGRSRILSDSAVTSMMVS